VSKVLQPAYDSDHSKIAGKEERDSGPARPGYFCRTAIHAPRTFFLLS
jgi:hypothetical protein